MDITHMISALNQVSYNLRYSTVTIPLDGFSKESINVILSNTPRRSVSFVAGSPQNELTVECSDMLPPPTLSRSPECKHLPFVRRPSTPIPVRTGIHPRTVHIANINAI